MIHFEGQDPLQFVNGTNDQNADLIVHYKVCTVKPVLETTCIKIPPTLRDLCSDTATLLKSSPIEPAFKDHLL